jgi:hypothetical protein
MIAAGLNKVLATATALCRMLLGQDTCRMIRV